MKQIKNTIFIYGLCLLAGLFITSCAPSLGSTMNVGDVSKIDFEPVNLFEQDQVKLTVLQFADNRSIEAIAQIDGRLVKPEGDIAFAAQKIFESMARKSGIKLSLFNAPSIRGTIVEWRVKVIPSFPASSLEAMASITIELLDRESNVVHKSTYSGNFEEKNPFLSDSKIQASLGKAMSYAIGEVFKDNLFVSRLNTAANFTSQANY